ncbi:unnamed protein product [Prunus armeniaca]
MSWEDVYNLQRSISDKSALRRFQITLQQMPTWSHGSEEDDTVERKRLREFEPSRERSKI